MRQAHRHAQRGLGPLAAVLGLAALGAIGAAQAQAVDTTPPALADLGLGPAGPVDPLACGATAVWLRQILSTQPEDNQNAATLTHGASRLLFQMIWITATEENACRGRLSDVTEPIFARVRAQRPELASLRDGGMSGDDITIGFMTHYVACRDAFGTARLETLWAEMQASEHGLPCGWQN
ncbi:hypothetical protein [Roseicyclus persicicus]|uniref:Uncharacterized protein n=1 Tax=Roseicyclus persicicus TaxID=2650661 RepID=A0A7X6K0L0_9RHOB|nr:hypothetical protein [Roseibacterium persicicum]NKX45988.1 hypothetical protein [Roseibacterium persicicum]